MGKLLITSKTKQHRTNSTTYNRVLKDKENYYTMISNKLVKDERLTFTEVGLMTWILSNNDKFVINKGFIQKKSGLGRVVFNKSWSNLENLGYIQSNKFMVSGQGSVYHYIINEGIANSLIPNDETDMVSRESTPNKYQVNKYQNTKITSDFVCDENTLSPSVSDSKDIFNTILKVNEGNGVDTKGWRVNDEDELRLSSILSSSKDLEEIKDLIYTMGEREGLKYVSIALLHKDIYGTTDL